MSADMVGHEPLTMTPAEVARQLGISEWWVREQIRRGRVPHLRFGRRRIALLPAHVEAIIALVTVEPAGWRGPSGGAAGGGEEPPAGAVRGGAGVGAERSGVGSGDVAALGSTARSARAHRRRPHVQGDGLF